MAVICSWLAMEVTRVRKQNDAISSVRKLGGRVFFAHQFDPEEKPHLNPGNLLPMWVTSMIPDEYQRRVVAVNFPDYRTRFRDANSRNSEARWPTKPPPSRVNNQSLGLLRHTSQLRQLVLPCKNISDAGLEFVSGLKKLRALHLNDTGVTGTGLRHVSSLQCLVSINLANTPLTDDGLFYLRGLKNLESLILNGTEISDDGVAHLAALESLTHLQLRGTNITDAGIEQLKGIKNLKEVLLSGSRVTDQGLSELAKALPTCRVIDNNKRVAN